AGVEANPKLEITVDVERLVIEVPELGVSEPFPLDPTTQERFLEGLDEIGITLRQDDAIAAYEARRPAFKPSVAAG
ncbi:MAG: 3-isopropylmalate dehydratase small subunit, partial [Acidimicrobiia bacterium]|nr:3-isopropylmalate dehydratase small subunit [Acidimicrobiia bacterium]